MKNFTLVLEAYNGWNLPYAKTVYVELLNTTENMGLNLFVLPNNYTLECSLNAYIGVIFTGRPMPTEEEMLAANLT